MQGQPQLEHAAAIAAPATDTLAAAHAPAHAEENVFAEMIGELKNGQEWSFQPFGSLHLPYFFYDQGGFHYFSSEESLAAGGTYTAHEGHPVRTADGHAPTLDLSISRNVVILWVVGAILFLLLWRAVRRYRTSLVPTGLSNVFEIVAVFIRDEVVEPTCGRVGVRMLPFFLTLFLFILASNLLGLIPFGHSVTGDVSVTAGLAIIAFGLIQVIHIRENGLGGYLRHLTGGTHWLMWIVMIPVEILGLFTKPFALCIRLFANMTAGHVVILSLLGLIFFFKSLFVAPLSVGFSLFINLLELLVALIQAYVFTMLTSLFIGLGLPHGHAEHEHAQ